MKSYNHLFEILTNPDTIRQAIINASKHKASRPIVRSCLNNIDSVVEKVRYILENDLFQPRQHEVKIISEGSSQKEREIVQPDFKYEQIIHHAVVIVLKPIFMKGMYEYSCGSIPDRGNIYAKRYIERVIKRDPENTKYVLKLDIKKYFKSIKHNILKRMLSRIIHDMRFLHVLFIIIDSYADGLPLGYYTSQWFANFYLSGLDKHIKHTLRIKYYVRYMDDMILFAKSKLTLHLANRMIASFVSIRLGVRIKGNWQVFQLADKKIKHMRSRFIDFLGYRFYRLYTTLRRRILLKFIRKCNKIYKKERCTWYDCTQLMSYYGWAKHCNIYKTFNDHLDQSDISVHEAKNIISFHSRSQAMLQEAA